MAVGLNIFERKAIISFAYNPFDMMGQIEMQAKYLVATILFPTYSHQLNCSIIVLITMTFCMNVHLGL